MVPKLVDARGRACPEPVILTKRALEQFPEGVQVWVDNSAARDNVRRFAESKGFSVEVKEEGDDFLLAIGR